MRSGSADDGGVEIELEANGDDEGGDDGDDMVGDMFINFIIMMEEVTAVQSPSPPLTLSFSHKPYHVFLLNAASFPFLTTTATTVASRFAPSPRTVLSRPATMISTSSPSALAAVASGPLVSLLILVPLSPSVSSLFLRFHRKLLEELAGRVYFEDVYPKSY